MSEEIHKPFTPPLSTSETIQILKRLFDHHSFLYEAQEEVYGTFAHISEEDACEKIQKLWGWLEAMFDTPQDKPIPVERCAMILVNKGGRDEAYLLGNEAIVIESAGPDVQASSQKFPGWQKARQLLGFQEGSQSYLYSDAIIAGYYLYRSKHSACAKDLTSLDELLGTPAELVIPGVTREQELLTILDPQPAPPYYQRILFIFSCATPDIARTIKNLIRPLLTSFIGNWGQQLLMKARKYEGAVEAEKAIRQQQSHAMGTELSYIRALMGFAISDLNRQCGEIGKTGSLRQHLPKLLKAARLLAQSSNSQREAFPAAADRFFSDVQTLLRFHYFSPKERSFIRAIGSLLVDMGTPQININEDELVPLAESLDDAGILQRALEDLVLAQNKIKEARDHNRALLRLGESNMELSPVPAISTTLDDRIIENRLKRSIEIILFNMFERGLPTSEVAGETTYHEALLNHFGSEEGAAKARDHWRAFYRENRYGKDLSYPKLRKWLLEELVPASGLLLELPEMQGFGWTAGSDTGLITLEAWLKEALLNAFKYARPPHKGKLTEISVAWSFAHTLELCVSNTVGKPLYALPSKRGRYGSQFLKSAAQYLFPSGQLELIPGDMRITLRVSSRGGSHGASL